MAGAGAIGAIGPLKLVDPVLITDHIGGMKQTFSWVESYFKPSAPVETAPIDLPAAEKSTEPVPPAPIEESKPIAAPETVANTIPVPVPTEAKLAPVAPVKQQHRRRRTRRSAAPAAAVQSPKTSSKSAASGDKLVGSYVSVMLKSGREVKGIYQGKTANQYTIELPGMGPFQYPIENVTSIKPAE